MREASIRYITALHQMQHTIYSLEAGNITSEMAQREVADVAATIPRLDREWRTTLRSEG